NTLPEIKEINNLCHNKILSKNIFLSYQAFVNKDFSTAQSLIREALLAEPLLEPAIFISALVNMELKNYTLAVEQFAFIVGISPHFTTAKYNLAKSLRMSKKYDQAIQHFYEYISLMPSSAGSYYNLSLIYERKGLLEDAKKMAQMAYSLSPESETYKKRYDTYFS
ncbi:TPA: tetratricopeptide repeat protein, partial [Escherichia coli]